MESTFNEEMESTYYDEINENSSTEFYISLYEDVSDEKRTSGKNILEILTEHINETEEIKTVIKRGDTIATEVPHYRNDNVYIWDGKKVRCLEYDIYEYGNIPKEFVVTETEFSPDYWLNTIDCTCFYLSRDILKKVKFQYDEKEKTIYTYIKLKEKTWKAVGINWHIDFEEHYEENGKSVLKFYKRLMLESKKLYCLYIDDSTFSIEIDY